MKRMVLHYHTVSMKEEVAKLLEQGNSLIVAGKIPLLHWYVFASFPYLRWPLIEAPVPGAMKRHDWRLLYAIEGSELQKLARVLRCLSLVRHLTFVGHVRADPDY
jgi:hypothetical protein